MNRRSLAALCLVATIVLAGCLGGAAGPGTATKSTATPSPADSESTTARTTDSPSPADGTPAEPAHLPSTSDCLVDSVPSPTVTAGANDSLTGRTYPETPDSTNASAVAGYAAAFEEAYVYNAKLAEGRARDSTLNRVTAQVTRTNVTRIQGGYLVVVDGLGATNYEDGVHGDYGIQAVYRFTPDSIDRSRRVERGERDFLPVVAC